MAHEVVAAKPRLLERVSAAIRAHHYSRRTEEAYAFWIRKFILFHKKRHPSEMGAPEVSAFLEWLATVRKVLASTQNQALSALAAKPPQPTAPLQAITGGISHRVPC